MKQPRFPPRLPLGRFVSPRLDGARLARQWSSIDDRLRDRRTFPPLGMRVVAIVALVLVVVAISFPRRVADSRGTVDGVVLETAAGQEQSLTLPEGSRIALEGSSRVRLAHVATTDVRLELERGAVRFEVTHVDGRTFVIGTHDVTVHVVGTKLRVALASAEGGDTVADPPKAGRVLVSVSVTEGRVEVLRGTTPKATVSAGETWTASIGTPVIGPPTASLSPEPSQSVAPPKRPLLKRKLSASFHERFREGDYAGAFAEVESEDFATLAKQLDAQDHLELAIAARLSGHPNRAALVLDHLRLTFRTDPRAGIAALDLGRLRLDELNDPRGALDALDDAIASLPLSDALKEDAEARRVQALDKLGDLPSCVAARDVYLLQHPEGVHTRSVARRCNSP